MTGVKCMQYLQQLELGNRYTKTAISLHWMMAVLLVCLFAVGIYMH